MRIAVFGATGMAGSPIVTEAHDRGHHVVALSRHPTQDAHSERLTSQAIDVSDIEAIDPVLADSDVAVLTIRLAPGEESRLAPLTHGLLNVAARHGTRVLVVGGSAPLHSPNHPARLVIDDADYVPETWKQIARASLDQFRTCTEHAYGRWVYLSPPAVLEPGDRTGRYRRGTTTLLTDRHGVSRISAADLAIAAIDELEHPGHVQHFTVVQDLPA